MKLKTIIKSSIILLFFTTLIGFLFIGSVSAQNDGNVKHVQFSGEWDGISLRITKCQNGKYADCIAMMQTVRQTALTIYRKNDDHNFGIACSTKTDYAFIDDDSILIVCHDQQHALFH